MASTDAKPFPQKNVAYRVTFPIFDADGDLVTGATGLDSEISKDGGTFADCTNEATEIATSSGMYYLDLTSTEMNADTVAIIVKTSSSGAKTTPLVMYPEEAGDIRVNATQLNGTGLTGRDIGASVLLSPGTGTGQLDITSGVVKANLAQILGTALTETAGQIAAGFKKLFDVAAPVFTLTSINQTGDNYARVGAPAGASVSADIAAIKAVLPAALVGGRIDASVGAMASGVLTATAIAADAITAAKIADGAIDAATFAADTGHAPARANTAQAGAAGTITLDASASATTDFYKGMLVYLTGGTGAGQARLITAYNGTTKVATIAPNWATNPSATSTFAILPAGPADIQAILGAVVSTSTAQLGVNVVNLGGSAVDATAGLINANVKQISTDATAADNLEAMLDGTGGVTLSAVLGASAITATSIATDAITAGKIAADAIGASELAADAATEIATAVWAATTRLLTAGTNIVLAKGTGVTGFNDLDAAGVRSAVGLASANLDTQLDALPTNAELATALGTADDAVLAAIAALSIPTAGAIADAVHDEVVEGTTTLRQSIRLHNAALGAKASGLDTTAAVYRDLADSKDRIAATVDANGNRTAVTLDLT